MPSSRARAFIRSTKAPSLPETCSARAMEASLADFTAAALTSSSTVICSPGSSQIWLPPMEAACSEQVTGSSHRMEPSSMASMTSRRVMILVMEAGGMGSWAFFSKSSWPLPASRRTADRAGSSWAWAAVTAVSSPVIQDSSARPSARTLPGEARASATAAARAPRRSHRPGFFRFIIHRSFRGRRGVRFCYILCVPPVKKNEKNRRRFSGFDAFGDCPAAGAVLYYFHKTDKRGAFI